MDRWRGWLKQSYGKKLNKLHAWNAWVITLLAVTGLILYFPSLRGKIAFFRVGLKEFHIFLGVLSIILLLLYVPLMAKHVKQIWGRVNQQFNLGLVLFLLIGWSVSGAVLWQDRNLPKLWSVTALFWHDLLTWVGIPWVIYHSISRSRWLKQDELRDKKRRQNAAKTTVIQEDNQPSDGIAAIEGQEHSEKENPIQAMFKNPPFSRRTFIRWGTGLILVLAIGPSFYRWTKSIFDTGGTTLDEVTKGDGNQMQPNPTPLSESNPPIGKGGEGNFRVYTVTDIPSFSSDNWKFAVGGLVGQTLQLSWDDFLKIPRKVQVSDFHCVTGWSVYHVTWEGIPLSQLLDQVGVDKKAKFVKFYSGDNVYTDSLTLEQARMEDIMVAVLMDGKPIPQQLGGPVRLIVPKMYAYKSVKWLQAIELIEEEHVGFWEVRGYDTDAWVDKS